MSFSDVLFYFFALLSVVCAIMVITRRSPVASVIFLIGVFFALSGMFVLLDADFIAAVQVIVYAGAIMVLFLFVIMLLNLGHVEVSDIRGAAGRVMVALVGLAFLAVGAAYALPLARHGLASAGPQVTLTPEQLHAMIQQEGVVGVVARPLFQNYLVPFEATSLLLLVAIVGAVAIARREAP